MEDYPRNQRRFEARFASEQACREYLTQPRWPQGLRCPRCGRSKAWPAWDRLLQCAACGRQDSAAAGTLFHRSKLPSRLWFRATWLVASHKHGASGLGVQRELGPVSCRTAWTWLHKLRRAMVWPSWDRLHGRMEVDETYAGGAEEGVQRRQTVTKTLVEIAVEALGDGSEIRRIRMRVVADAAGPSLPGFVREAVEPGTTVHTYGWPSYS